MIESGTRIEDLLKRKGWKKNKFASYLGINVSTLSRILSGKQPLSEKLASKMAEALNVSIDYILCLSEDLTPPETKEYSISKEMLDANRQQLIFSSIVRHLKLLGLEFSWQVSTDRQVLLEGEGPWPSKDDKCKFKMLFSQVPDLQVYTSIIFRDKCKKFKYIEFLRWLKTLFMHEEAYILSTFGIGIDIVGDEFLIMLEGNDYEEI